MHWSPSAFWRSTPHEFWAAYEVWKAANIRDDED
ncbi:phage tail assembly chaperone [Sphingobium boeckii]